MNRLFNQATGSLQNVLGNPYVNAAITLFLVLYGGLARPQLPDFLMKLFDNAMFRLLVLFGIAFTASRNVQIALMVAVAFTITMNLLNEQKMVEGFLQHRARERRLRNSN